MKVLIYISRLLSALLHPFFVPTIALFVLFSLNIHISFTLTPKGKQVLLILVLINTAFLPMLMVLLLKKTRLISSIALRERQDRIIPLLIGTAIYIANYFLLLRIDLHPLINIYFAGATLVVLAALVFTLWLKISLHMMGIGAVSAFFYSIALIVPSNFLPLIAASFVLSGLLGSARLILESHNASQVFAGFFVGFGVMIVLFLYVAF